MPHQVRVLRAVVHRGVPLMLLATAACRRTGEVRVLADTTMAPGAVEVFAIPAASAPPSMEPARYAAESLAARFRGDRARLVARADSLAHADRRTAAYAAAYADYLADAAAAERLRTARDSAARSLGPPHPVPESLLAHAVRARIASGGATLVLRVGAWWLGGLDSRRVLLRPALRVEIGPSRVDTVMLK